MAVTQERKGKDGKTNYRALTRLEGHLPASATFTRRTDAKKWTATSEVEIRDGRCFKPAEAKKPTISDLIKRPAEEVLPPKPKNSPNHKIHLRWWKGKIGDDFLADVNTAMIIECRDKLKKDRDLRGHPRIIGSGPSLHDHPLPLVQRGDRGMGMAGVQPPQQDQETQRAQRAGALPGRR